MTWRKDGSGLLVYRHRGRTVGSRWPFELAEPTPRWARRYLPASAGPASLARGPFGPKRRRRDAKAWRTLDFNPYGLDL